MYSAKLLCFASFKAISAVELSATKWCWIFQVPVVLLLLNNTSTFYLYKYKSFFPNARGGVSDSKMWK